MLLSSNMEKERLCRIILKDLKKEEVGVKVSMEIKGNYYSYIHNCIYLNGREMQNKEDEAKENVVIAHECIHATQSKIVHFANFILANLELLLFAIYFCISIAFENVLSFKIIYIIFWGLSILFRMFLEVPAMMNSFNLALKHVNKDVNKIIKEDRNKMKFLFPLGILSFTWFKILRLIIVLLL